MLKIAVLVACLVALAFAAPAELQKRASVTGTATISFSGNVTLTNNTQSGYTLAYRKVNAQVVSVSLLGVNFNGFFSEAVQINKAPTQGSLDAVAAGFYTVTGAYPVGYVAYFDVASKFSGYGTIANPTSIVGSLTLSAGLVGIAFINVAEINSAGTVVNTVDFSSLNFNEVSTSVQTDSTGNLNYAWVAATSGAATYNFTAVQSSVVGKLPYGAVVTPKSADVVLEIDNYPYAATTNNLRLTFAVAYGVLNINGSAIVSGTNALVAGLGTNQVWISSATTAAINGNSQGVTVSVSITASTNLPQAIQTALTDITEFINTIGAGSSAGYAVVTVNFPAGATTIVYDPTAGFEQPQTNSGAVFRSSVFAVLFASAIAFFFGSNL